MKDGKVYGAAGFSIKKEEAIVIRAKKVIISTGGAAGLYKPNNPGFQGIRCGIRHLILGQDMQWEFWLEQK